MVPATILLVANGALLGIVVTNSALLGLVFTNSALLGLVTNSALLGLVTNSALLGLVTNSALLGLVTNSALLGLVVTNSALLGLVVANSDPKTMFHCRCFHKLCENPQQVPCVCQRQQLLNLPARQGTEDSRQGSNLDDNCRQSWEGGSPSSSTSDSSSDSLFIKLNFLFDGDAMAGSMTTAPTFNEDAMGGLNDSSEVTSLLIPAPVLDFSCANQDCFLDPYNFIVPCFIP